MSKATLFDATTINGLELKNRFVRSATYLGMAAPDGSCSQRIIDNAVGLAQGDVGLIITGIAAVTQGGQGYPLQMCAYSDDFVPGLTAMAEAVHENSGRIALQLFHGGIFSNPEITGQQALGPSVMQTEQGPVGKEMTAQEIQQIVAAFGEAAARAQDAGFDAVQIHGAHGYLQSQFLSPLWNARQDDYGGSIENRARMLLETVDAIRAAVGPDYPILVKINSEDLVDGGFSVDEMLQTAAMLEEAGVDAIEISGGTTLALLAGNPDASWGRTEPHRIYYEQAARRYKLAMSTPLILVGGSRCFAECQRLLDEGVTDYVAMSRPLLREPGLIKRWQSGDLRDSACISDNLCIFESLKGTGVRCVYGPQ